MRRDNKYANKTFSELTKIAGSMLRDVIPSGDATRFDVMDLNEALWASYTRSFSSRDDCMRQFVCGLIGRLQEKFKV